MAKWARLGALATLLMLVLSACARSSDAPQSTLNPDGSTAQAPDDLWNLTLGIAVVIFFLVEGVLVFAMVRFRHREGREAKQFHGNTKVEILLTVIPALILAGIAVPTVGTVFELAEDPDGAMQIEVIGHQFWWEYRYPDLDIVTANELHIPVDTEVRLTIQGATTDAVDGSAEVIHSFWVPRLAGTQDIVPGHTNHLLMNADETGRYLGQCKEYCGLSHANMRVVAYVDSQEDFDEWVSDQQSPPPQAVGDAATGEAIFNGEQGDGSPPCASCHNAAESNLDAQPATGPNLAHFALRSTFAGATFRNNPENLAAWIADPAGVKPGAKMPDTGLSDQDIQDVIAYLQTLE
jgi:cytochrome c oxidase subunit 2